MLFSAVVSVPAQVRYQIDASTPTGTCAVCVTGIERSLVANLAAANNFKVRQMALLHTSLQLLQQVLSRARFCVQGLRCGACIASAITCHVCVCTGQVWAPHNASKQPATLKHSTALSACLMNYDPSRTGSTAPCSSRLTLPRPTGTW